MKNNYTVYITSLLVGILLVFTILMAGKIIFNLITIKDTGFNFQQFNIEKLYNEKHN